MLSVELRSIKVKSGFDHGVSFVLPEDLPLVIGDSKFALDVRETMDRLSSVIGTVEGDSIHRKPESLDIHISADFLEKIGVGDFHYDLRADDGTNEAILMRGRFLVLG